MTRKQILAIVIIVLLTTVTGLVFTATIPIWLPVLLLLPASTRDQLMSAFQENMTRQTVKFMFSANRATRSHP